MNKDDFRDESSDEEGSAPTIEESSSDSSRVTPKVRNREKLREELWRTLDGSVDWLKRSEQHLLKIFRFYIVVLGIFISALSYIQVQDLSSILNAYTLGAIFFWLIAAIGAVVAYTVIHAVTGIDDILYTGEAKTRSGGHYDKKMGSVFEGENPEERSYPYDESGIDADHLREILNKGPAKFEEILLYYHVQAIERNNMELSRIRYPFLYTGMALVLVSVLVFGIGVLVSISGDNLAYLVWPTGGTGQVRALAVFGNVFLIVGAYLSIHLLGKVLRFRGRINNALSMLKSGDYYDE